MQVLRYVPPGGNENDPEQAAVFSLDPPFILATVSGVSGVEQNILSDPAAGLDGVYAKGTRVEPRTVSATIHVQGITRPGMYEKRMRLLNLLRPDQKPGTLYYQNDHIAVRTEAYPKNGADFVRRIKNYNQGELQFFCPSPFWESVEESTPYALAFVGNGFRFPFKFDRLIRFASRANVASIHNTGSAPAPLMITIQGPATNPAILNLTTGEKIQVDREIEQGDALEVSTMPGQKTVTLRHGNGDTEDAFQYLSLDSVFFSLRPGGNELRYESGNESQQTRVIVRYSERFAGV